MASLEYFWANRFPSRGVDPQVAGEVIERLREEHDGYDPDLLLEEARPVSSPLHPLFEWVDTVAAHKYRIEQAQQITRSCMVLQVRKGGGEPVMVRAFHHVVEKGVPKYQSITVIKRRKDLSKQVPVVAWQELSSWYNRYLHIREMLKIDYKVQDILDSLESETD